MVSRTGGSSGAISVNVTSSDGTAAAGTDYVALNTTVNFADGDVAAKAVTLTIVNDTIVEPSETVMLTLSNPTGGATLGNAADITSTITIDNDDNDPDDGKPTAASLAIGFEVKKLAFAWNAASRATSYKLMRRDSAAPDFVQVGADLAAAVTTTKFEIPVHRYNWVTDVPRYRLDACNASGCTPSNIVTTPQVGSVAVTGYLKASDTKLLARFGKAMAVSSDGKTVAIGAPSTSGIGGNVYVYMAPTVGDRVLAARPVKIPAPSAETMFFGFSVALSEDGKTLAVGAPFDSHLQTGVGTYPAVPNADSPRSGGVFIYSRVGNAWSTTPVYLKASDVDTDDMFGFSVALRSTTLVVGAPHQDSPTDGADITNAAVDSGAAYTFFAGTGNWVQSDRILKASNIGNGDNFGSSVALGGGGSVLIVGAPQEDGDGSGVDPVDTDTKADSGAVYRFVAAGAGIPEDPPQWGVPQRFKASNSGAGDLYGFAVAMDSSGSVFAVGAPREDSTSIENQNDDGNDVGAVYSYVLPDAGPFDVAYLKAARRQDGAQYGFSLAVSGDATVLAVGSPGDSVDRIGVDGDAGAPATAAEAGAVDVFARQIGANWSPQADLASGRHYVKAIDMDAQDFFGAAVALNGDGNTLVVGASGEDGNGTNIDGNNNPADNSIFDSGAAYLY